MFGAIEVRYLARPQLRRQRKLRPRHEPMREVITLRVIHQAVGGNGLQLLFKLVQIFGAANFALIWHPADEISEPEMIGQKPPQILEQRRRALSQKRISFRMRTRPKL